MHTPRRSNSAKRMSEEDKRVSVALERKDMVLSLRSCLSPPILSYDTLISRHAGCPKLFPDFSLSQPRGLGAAPGMWDQMLVKHTSLSFRFKHPRQAAHATLMASLAYLEQPSLGGRISGHPTRDDHAVQTHPHDDKAGRPLWYLARTKYHSIFPTRDGARAAIRTRGASWKTRRRPRAARNTPG